MSNRQAFVAIPVAFLAAANALLANPALDAGGQGTFSRPMGLVPDSPYETPAYFAGCGQIPEDVLAAFDHSRSLWDLAEVQQIPVEERGPLVMPFCIILDGEWTNRENNTPPLFYTADPV